MTNITVNNICADGEGVTSAMLKCFPDPPTDVHDFELPREYFTLVGSDAYRNVKDNLYGNVDRYVDVSQDFSVTCSCTVEEGCGSQCQNRLLYM